MSHAQQPSINEQQPSIEPNVNRQLKAAVPDPEVVVSASRRQFSPSYKRQIVAEAEQCSDNGQIGALLRREGLYSSHLSRWRQAQERGELEAAAGPKRGRPTDAQAAENARLKRENERLQQALAQAQLVIDIQKKVSQLLGLRLTTTDEPK